MLRASDSPALEHRQNAKRIVNAITIDVEEYFQVQAFAGVIRQSDWQGLESRVERTMEMLLDCLAAANVACTMFTLGWVAERKPELVRRFVAAGHEVASHGFAHENLGLLTPARFRIDIRRAKELLEDIGGVAVRGYRAPTFSVNEHTRWAYAVLEEEGYHYSSSVYPVRHDLYGSPNSPRLPYRPEGVKLWELPMTTVPLLGQNVPCSGGGYFRLVPYPLFRRGIETFNRTTNAPGIFYTHPWEFDPDQPRVSKLPPLARFRHYCNLKETKGRFERLLTDFGWDRMDRVYAETLQRA